MRGIERNHARGGKVFDKVPIPLAHRQEHFHPRHLQRLKLIGTFSGHSGCINRLCFDPTGRWLASCSDDLSVGIWDVGVGRQFHFLSTSHSDNLMGVRFLPGSDGLSIVTGAMDGMIELSQLSDDLSVRLTSDQFFCHRSGVKYVETELSSPNVFFSAGDDGFVRQYDRRLPYAGCRFDSVESNSCVGSMFSSRNCVVINASGAKVNSVRVNPVFPNFLVVASKESVVKVYDRRMISLSGPDAGSFGLKKSLARSFCPEHLVHSRSAFPTYAEFSPCGRSLLVNYHCENSYCFDLFGRELEDGFLHGSEAFNPAPLLWRRQNAAALSVESKQLLANKAISAGQQTYELGLYLTASGMFTRALEIVHSLWALHQSRTLRQERDRSLATLSAERREIHDITSRVLLSRALVFERRSYIGDDSAGLSDVQLTLNLMPSAVDARILKCKFLLNLNRLDDAQLEWNVLRNLLQITSQQGELGVAQSEVLTLERRLEEKRLQITLGAGDSRPLLLLEESEESTSGSSLPRGSREEAKKRKRRIGVTDSQVNEASAMDTQGKFEEEPRASAPRSSSSRSKSGAFKQDASPRSLSKRTSLFTAYSQRFVGAANVATDIQETIFLGSHGEYVAGGSDDGRLFVWDRYTGEILVCRLADPDLLNCVQMHPRLPLLATSGLDDSVRMWGPSTLKTMFSFDNKHEPFKAQCGKLELPELSRLRFHSQVMSEVENRSMEADRNMLEGWDDSSTSSGGRKSTNEDSSDSFLSSSSIRKSSCDNTTVHTSQRNESSMTISNDDRLSNSDNDISIHEEDFVGGEGGMYIASEPPTTAAGTIALDTDNGGGNLSSNPSNGSNSNPSDSCSHHSTESTDGRTTNESNKALRSLDSATSASAGVLPPTSSNNKELSTSSSHSHSTVSDSFPHKNVSTKPEIMNEKQPPRLDDADPRANKKAVLELFRQSLRLVVAGQPLDADEVIALEEIVADNQKLIKYCPSPG